MFLVAVPMLPTPLTGGLRFQSGSALLLALTLMRTGQETWAKFTTRLRSAQLWLLQVFGGANQQIGDLSQLFQYVHFFKSPFSHTLHRLLSEDQEEDSRTGEGAVEETLGRRRSSEHDVHGQYPDC